MQLLIKINKDLYSRMKTRAGLLNMEIKTYLAMAFEEALKNPKFSPGKFTAQGEEVKKNIVVDQEQYKQIKLTAAELDITAKDYICAAIATSLEKREITYPTGEEVIIVDTVRLDPKVKEYLITSSGKHLTPEDLVTRFAKSLADKDERLVSWLKEQK